IGALVIRRPRSEPFTDAHVTLIQTFADQAVIAIENARLFQELQASNQELTTALDRQTATGEVLEGISHSPTQLQAVFDAIVQSAARLLAAEDAVLYRVEGAELVVSAGSGPGADRWTAWPRRRWSLQADRPPTHAVRERRNVHIPDVRDLPA